VKRLELHADYLAGYYAGAWKLKKHLPGCRICYSEIFVGDSGRQQSPAREIATTGLPLSVRLQSFAASRLRIVSSRSGLARLHTCEKRLN